MNSVQWNDYFNIGVDTIDRAHQRLFSIAYKMMSLADENTMKQQHACRETIKYFKNYAIKHFAEEEAYMKSIDYSGYAMHKQLHDNMRDKTLPALERELVEEDYSKEAVQHFLGICIGWLTGHIMVEDHAITGRSVSKWDYNPAIEEETAVLERATKDIMKQVLKLDVELVNKHYGGEDFGKGVFFRFTYRSKKGEKCQVFLGYEERLLLHAFGKILGKTLYKVDETVVYAAKQLSQQYIKRLGMIFEPLGAFQLEKEAVLSYEQLLGAFEKKYPNYSLLYSTGKNGYFAFGIKK